ncbi:MAG: hypothetical protein EXR58_03565 [Chloroflexi bacterium]|nr:hypothetical protein [Chloroflexota bacterium]
MIARIIGGGQYRIADDALAHLNQLDDAVVAAVATGRESDFRAAFEALLAAVRSKGALVPPTEFVTSELVLPYEGITLAEAQDIFVGQGLIP